MKEISHTDQSALILVGFDPRVLCKERYLLNRQLPSVTVPSLNSS